MGGKRGPTKIHLSIGQGRNEDYLKVACHSRGTPDRRRRYCTTEDDRITCDHCRTITGNGDRTTREAQAVESS